MRRDVHDLLERQLPEGLLVLADPVEDDDRVVDRESDDGQERGDDRQVDLAAGERIDAAGDEDVLGQGEDGRDAVGQLEPDGDVDEHSEERPDRGLDGLAAEVLAGLRTDGLAADDGDLAQVGLVLQDVDDVGPDAGGRELGEVGDDRARFPVFDDRPGELLALPGERRLRGSRRATSLRSS